MQGEFLSIETAQKLATAKKKEKAWDELKKWLDEKLKDKICDDLYYEAFLETNNKVQELEGDVK